jgi:hypothetical protein
MKNPFTSRGMNQIILLILMIAMLNLIHSCYYYKVTRSQTPPGPALVKYEGDKNFIILHQDTNVWHFTNIIAGEDSIRGMLSNLRGHTKYKTTNPDMVNRYKKTANKDESGVLNEVHIYTSYLAKLPFNEVSIPVKSVNKIEVYDPATGATVASWVFGTLGVVVPAVVIIALLTKSSCPFIYINNGQTEKFIGEIYSGAIYPSLERQDYLPLPGPQPGLNKYSVRMTNEMHEIQHTNFIGLEVFDHPKGTKVLVDKYGKYQTVSNLHTPMEARNLKGEDVLDILQKEDSLLYLGDNTGKEQSNTDGLILTFKRPPKTDHFKLVIRAKNSFWLDYVFTRFHELFGKEYNCWAEQQKKVSGEKMRNWNLEQNIPISVYVEKNGKWKFADYYNITGPMALKEDILSLDLPDSNEENLRIKLVYGYLFWEVDYTAIDFTDNVPVKQSTAIFESAVDNYGRDVRYLMADSDTLYYIQPEIGDAVTMNFSLPGKTDNEQTLILHSKGYYHIIMNLTGEEQVRYLLSFRKKGRFPAFSNELYQRQLLSETK